MYTTPQVAFVDDDEELAEAVVNFLSNEGYMVKFFKLGSGLLRNLDPYNFHVVITDIMLPDIGGLELVEQVQAAAKKQNTPAPSLILTSGVFTSTDYIKYATKKSSTKSFLAKPYKLLDLNEIIKSHLLQGSVLRLTPLMETLTKNSQSSTLHTLKQQSKAQAYDLPQIYSQLSLSDFTGSLSISTLEGKVTRLQYHKGHIVHSACTDDQTYAGQLFVQEGLLTGEEIDKALKDKPPTEKLGEFLVKRFYISPHHTPLMLARQAKNRIKNTMQNLPVKITISAQEAKSTPRSLIDPAELSALIATWVQQHVSTAVLKDKYFFVANFKVLPHKNSAERLKPLMMLPIASGMQSFLPLADPGIEPRSMQQVLDGFKNPSTYSRALMFLHFLLIQNVLVLDSGKSEDSSFELLAQKLQNTLSSLKKKNYIQILGLNMDRVRLRDVEVAHNELTHIYHPDAFPKKAPQKIIELSSAIFSMINSAYQNIKTQEKLEDYIAKLKAGSQTTLTPEEAMKKGLIQLKQKKYKGSLHYFFTASNSEEVPHSTTYLIIANLLIGTKPGQNVQNLVQSMTQLQKRIPQDQRKSAEFFCMRGLMSSIKGRNNEAIMLLKQALKINPKFSLAKEQLIHIQRTQKDAPRGLSKLLKR